MSQPGGPEAGRQIAEADLDEIQRFLLVNCVQTYLELTPEETADSWARPPSTNLAGGNCCWLE